MHLEQNRKLQLKFLLISLSCAILIVSSYDMVYSKVALILMILSILFLGICKFVSQSVSILFVDICFYFLCVYTIIFKIALVCYGFSLEEILTDIISVTIATNLDEVSAFITNTKSRAFIPVYKLLLAIVFYYLSGKISFIAQLNSTVKKIVYFMTAFFFTGLFIVPDITFSEFRHRLPQGINDIFATKQYIEQTKRFYWNAKSNLSGKSTAVIVLGETTRGDHMYINGYKRNTNPRLSKENIISFDNCISLDVHTLVSTPYILTRKPLTEETIYKLHPEKSLISAFGEAGYKTFYISYLSKIHSGDNAINQIAKEADQYIQRPWGNGFDGDSLALPIMENIIKNDIALKKLIVLKLIGSHLNFQDRYPKQYDVFKPSFTTEPYHGDDISQKDVFINTYDNSMLHTDYVLGEILSYLKSVEGDVTFSFVSDHGISIYEDGKTLYINFKKANYNIPCFFWFNSIAEERIGESNLLKLKENIHKPIDTTYFLDTVLRINDIDTEKRRNKSLFDNISNTDNRKVIYGNKVILFKDIKE